MASPTSAKAIKSRAKGNAEASTAQEWKQKDSVVQLPSGINVRLRRPGMEKFLSSGFLPDALAKEIGRQIKLAQGFSPTKIKEEETKLKDALGEADVEQMMHAMNRVTAYTVVEPTVEWHMRPKIDEEGEHVFEDDEHTRPVYESTPEDERDENVVYTDEIDMEDKQFIFQYAVGGVSDLNTFREQSKIVMDTVAAGGTVEDAAKRVAGNQ